MERLDSNGLDIGKQKATNYFFKDRIFLIKKAYPKPFFFGKNREVYYTCNCEFILL